MQKIVNVLAVASAAVSVAVVGTGAFVYVQRDAILENVKEKALESITGSLGGSLTPDIGVPLSSPDAPAAAAPAPSLGLPAPSSAF